MYFDVCFDRWVDVCVLCVCVCVCVQAIHELIEANIMKCFVAVQVPMVKHTHTHTYTQTYTHAHTYTHTRTHTSHHHSRVVLTTRHIHTRICVCARAVFQSSAHIHRGE